MTTLKREERKALVQKQEVFAEEKDSDMKKREAFIKPSDAFVDESTVVAKESTPSSDTSQVHHLLLTETIANSREGKGSDEASKMQGQEEAKHKQETSVITRQEDALQTDKDMVDKDESKHETSAEEISEIVAQMTFNTFHNASSKNDDDNGGVNRLEELIDVGEVDAPPKEQETLLEPTDKSDETTPIESVLPPQENSIPVEPSMKPHGPSVRYGADARAFLESASTEDNRREQHGRPVLWCSMGAMLIIVIETVGVLAALSLYCA